MQSNAITVIHKYLRREMFDFAERLFRAGPEHAAEIRGELERIARLLSEHAQDENTRLAPLLREQEPALAEHLMADHRQLADRLEGLLRAANRIEAASPNARSALLRLHLDWNRFLSAYLLHLDDQERTLFARLGDRLPPLSAIADSARKQGPRGEELLLRLWAVTTCEERAAIIEPEPGVVLELA